MVAALRSEEVEAMLQACPSTSPLRGYAQYERWMSKHLSRKYSAPARHIARKYDNFLIHIENAADER